MPVLLVKPVDDRQHRLSLASQKGAQHLVVGFALVVLGHIPSSRSDRHRPLPDDRVTSVVSGPSLYARARRSASDDHVRRSGC